MSYELLSTLCALAGFGITVGTVIARLASVIARLNTTVTDFSGTVTTLRKDNAIDHRAIREALSEHEHRITVLEGKIDAGH